MVAAGCGGDDPKPAAEKPRAAATPDGCAAAKKAIAALPKPKDTAGIADYANQAADALEPAERTAAVQPLRDAELASIELKIEPLHAAVAKLDDAGGECGEREALNAIALVTYSFGWEEAVKADKRSVKRIPDDLSLQQAARYDERRQRRLVAAMEKLTVPERLERPHQRYVSASRAFADACAEAATGDFEAQEPKIERLSKRIQAAFDALQQARNRLVPD